MTLAYHFNQISPELTNEESAKEYACGLNEIIKTLSDKYPVYIRRRTTVSSDTDFRTQEKRWVVSARYCVVLNSDKPPGEQCIVRNHEDIIAPFGLPPSK